MLIKEAEYEKINEAIVRFQRPKERKQEMLDAYGMDIVAKVEALYSEAMDCPVDWKTATMASALDALHDFLNTNYPWLTPEAKTHLNYDFIMCWK